MSKCDDRNDAAAIEPRRFREILGQYPTGVCVITAMLPSGPIGMVVGSFTSVSLDPPLVAFFPDKNSGSWARLNRSPRFCVNILSAEQESICRKLASRDPDKFASMAYQLSPGGSPMLEGVVAWIDCDLHSVSEAGDHLIVLGQVRGLEIAQGGLPLLFFQGGYGRFAPASLMACDTHGLVTEQLGIVDLAREEMEWIATQTGGQCVASILLGNELIVAATAGQASGHVRGVSAGRRLPFAPPLGASFAAWLPDEQVERWIGRDIDPAERQAYKTALATVRGKGFAVALPKYGQLEAFAAEVELRPRVFTGPCGELEDFVRGLDFDPREMEAEIGVAVRIIHAPVFDSAGRVVLSLTLQGFPAPCDDSIVNDHVATLLQGTMRITERVHSHQP